jgi:hypothetical protein
MARLNANIHVRRLASLVTLATLGGASCGISRPLVDDASVADTSVPDAATDVITQPADYHGVVLAKIDQGAAGDSMTAFAAFLVGGQPAAFTAPIGSHPSAGACSCVRGHATPILTDIVDASTISVDTAAGTPWARLDPRQPSVDGGSTSFQLSGTFDLGASWYVTPGRYSKIAASGPVEPGAKLAVTAAGGTVDAFSGAIVMGGRLLGVTPPLGSQDQSIPRQQDFRVSWTPDAAAGQTVLLSMRQIGAQSLVACFCEAADEAGTLTMPAELLALYEATPASCTVQLARLNVATVSRGNATTQLIAETAVSGTATVE